MKVNNYVKVLSVILIMFGYCNDGYSYYNENEYQVYSTIDKLKFELHYINTVIRNNTNKLISGKQLQNLPDTIREQIKQQLEYNYELINNSNNILEAAQNNNKILLQNKVTEYKDHLSILKNITETFKEQIQNAYPTNTNPILISNEEIEPELLYSANNWLYLFDKFIMPLYDELQQIL